MKVVFLIIVFVLTLFASRAAALCGGCDDCTDEVLDTLASGHSCRDRINYLMEEKLFDEEKACARVGGTEFASECGRCNSKTCDGRTRTEKAPSFYCGCEQCTQKVWDKITIDHSCGARISYLTDFLKTPMNEACSLVAVAQFPEECGVCDPKTCSKESSNDEDEEEAEELVSNVGANIYGLPCGCDKCTADVWNADAGGLTCGERIEWLVGDDRTPEDACFQVAAAEFPLACGGCIPSCDGGLLDGGSTEMTLSARTELYCFPSFKKRTRFRNVWGKYTVEVKESDAVCGPSDNKFTNNTVSLVENKHIKLQFKKVGGAWEASEVRVRLPENQMPFLYGQYSFSLKSVEVIDTISGSVIDNVLPQSLILGLFTWDDTENYAAKENFNHEVDIEISRWDIPGNQDLQFLVQPPGDPHKARFFSGPDESYKQAPRTFDFDWRPAEIKWTGDRGESLVYSAQSALDAGASDFTQCLPADVEVRMNLWNLYGTAKPTGMQDHHVVEVVIDDFTFTPSGLTEVPEGGFCSKDCQCGESATCIDNSCQSDRRLNQVSPDRGQKTYENQPTPSLRAGSVV